MRNKLMIFAYFISINLISTYYFNINELLL